MVTAVDEGLGLERLKADGAVIFRSRRRWGFLIVRDNYCTGFLWLNIYRLRAGSWGRIRNFIRFVVRFHIQVFFHKIYFWGRMFLRYGWGKPGLLVEAKNVLCPSHLASIGVWLLLGIPTKFRGWHVRVGIRGSATSIQPHFSLFFLIVFFNHASAWRWYPSSCYR